MQDIVIVPTFSRPEMLWLCLEYLSACHGVKKMEIRVYVDNHVGQPPPKVEIEQVLERFAPHLTMQVAFRHSHGYHGNSYNLLMAYKEAYQDDDIRHVFMVEDDVMAMPKFFDWHFDQHLKRGTNVSIGVVQEPQHKHYASLGVCFKRDTLKLIVPHCKTSYFQNVTQYCRQVFPPSQADCEQDGLWCRVLQGGVVWATEPVAQHVGWYGYHRKRSIRPQGTLEERYRQVKETLTDPALLKIRSRDFGDIKPLRSPLQLVTSRATVVDAAD